MANVKQAQSAVKARSGDAMDMDPFTTGSKGASEGSGKKQDSEVVCCYCEKKGHRASDCRKKQRDNDSGKSKGSKKGDSKGKSNREKFKGKCYKCGKTGYTSKDCRSKETSAFEAGDELAETGCIEVASVDLNALEIGAMQLPEKGHRIRIGIDSCAAVTVFPKSVEDDYSMLDMPGKAKSYRPASGKLLPDLGARKVQVKLRDVSLRYVNARVADTHRALMAVSEMNDMGHDVFFPRCDRGIKAYAYHESSGTKLQLERVNGVFRFRTCPIQPEHIEERHIRSVFFTFCSGTDQGHDGQGYDCGPPKLTRACNAVSPTKEALLQPLVSVLVEVLEVAT